MQYNTPLRYPGGKGRLAQYVIDVLKLNKLTGGHYVEPYAGGAAIGISLLYLEYIDHFHLNDINDCVHAFWHSALTQPDELCALIRDTPISIDERLRQKATLKRTDSSKLERGFATFYLNRTNRSGIISGGVIGGNHQMGEWKIDARFNKNDLIKRVEKVSSYASRITLTQIDASKYITENLISLPSNSLVYLDPPYYRKGQKLYQNHYKHRDHENISKLVPNIKQKWLVSYDNVEPIKELYASYETEVFALSWSARTRYDGSEIMVFGPGLSRPECVRPWRGLAA